MDQQGCIHLVDQPMMVLDLEWPGFTTKTLHENSQIPHLNDDCTISTEFGREEGIFIGVKNDNSITVTTKESGDGIQILTFKNLKQLSETPRQVYHTADNQLFN